MTPETTAKQVAQFAKVLTHIFDMVSKAREEWDVEASTRPGIQQTSSLSDTHALLTAIGLGKGQYLAWSLTFFALFTRVRWRYSTFRTGEGNRSGLSNERYLFYVHRLGAGQRQRYSIQRAPTGDRRCGTSAGRWQSAVGHQN